MGFMEVGVFQIIALTLYAFLAILDGLGTDIGLSKPIQAGFFAGLVMGDVTTGLIVGATLQLMILGVGTYGGASIPDFMSGALLGTVFAVISGKGAEFGIGLAVPIGLFLVQIDVLARFSNTYFQHKADKYAEVGDTKGIERMNILGALPWGLSRAIPVFLALIFGSTIVQSLLKVFPNWIMGGLKVAGGILPALGIAILLRYLPVKRYIAYLLLGFVLAAYLKVPMVGVAIAGLAVAYINYHNSEATNMLTGGASQDE
jgi:PTS system mannose-specific IIC component